MIAKTLGGYGTVVRPSDGETGDTYMLTVRDPVIPHRWGWVRLSSGDTASDPILVSDDDDYFPFRQDDWERVE